jgi:uncharacterized protein (DUF362 family)
MTSRRRFLALLAGGAGGAVLAPLVHRLAAAPRRASEVHVLAAHTYASLTPEALRAAIPVRERARVRGRRVLLKPNLVEFHPDRPIHTDARLVAAVIETFARLGAADVVVAEGPGHRRDTDYLLAASGLRDVVRRAGVRFTDLNLDRTGLHAIPGGGLTRLGHLALPATLTEADYVVTMPKMKTHHWVGVTLSLKNLFGVLPGAAYGWPKNLFHWRGIPASILDVNRTVSADLAIVDGVVGMEGDGPVAGDPVPSGAVVVGTALAAVDATCCRLMGVRPEAVPYLVAAARHHGSIRPADIVVTGTAVTRLARPYRLMPHFRHLQAAAQRGPRLPPG